MDFVKKIGNTFKKVVIFSQTILIILTSGCSSGGGISGKYADLKKPSSVIELKSDNTFYVEKKEADGKTSILKGEYSIKDNYLYTEKILTLDGKDVPRNLSDNYVAASRSQPMKIDGLTLISNDKESVYTRFIISAFHCKREFAISVPSRT
jgi:hypothetical protein